MPFKPQTPKAVPEPSTASQPPSTPHSQRPSFWTIPVLENITADLRQLETKPKPHHSRWAPPALSPNRAELSPESNPSRTPPPAPWSCLLPPHQVSEKCPLLPKDKQLGQGELSAPLSGNTPCTTVPTVNSMALCTRPARTCWKRPLNQAPLLEHQVAGQGLSIGLLCQPWP